MNVQHLNTMTLACKRRYGKVCIQAKLAHQAGAYPGFHSMKQLGVSLLSPEWDASPSQGYPKPLFCRYPFIHLGEERHYENELFCPRTRRNVPATARTWTIQSGVQCANHYATDVFSHKREESYESKNRVKHNKTNCLIAVLRPHLPG